MPSLELAVPRVGNLDAYIQAANRMPFLTAEEEARLAHLWREQGDKDAAGKLVLSHLRLVVSTARQYLGYGLPHADLIQEGNIGLMKAVKRFDPAHGVRLVSYALHWIKAEIHEYILRNGRMVRLATTKAQRKLFFNLRSLHAGGGAMSESQINAVAQKLDVKPAEVREMEQRLSGADVALEPTAEDGEESFAPIAYLADPATEPAAVLEARGRDWLQGEGLEGALEQLDPRSRAIVEQRWLQVDDDGSGGKTLHDLAVVYGVSAERIRQIEVAVMKKMRRHLETSA